MSEYDTPAPLLGQVEYRALDFLGLPGCRVGSDGTVESQWQRQHGKGGVFCWQRQSEWRTVPFIRLKNGYLRVRLRWKLFPVHHLVLLAFVGPRPPGAECRHLDGSPANNSAGNLAWGTSKENHADMARHGTTSRGERNGLAKLTEEDVREIRRLYATGEWMLKALAERFGVKTPTLWAAATGKTWKHVKV